MFNRILKQAKRDRLIRMFIKYKNKTSIPKPNINKKKCLHKK